MKPADRREAKGRFDVVDEAKDKHPLRDDNVTKAWAHRARKVGAVIAVATVAGAPRA